MTPNCPLFRCLSVGHLCTKVSLVLFLYMISITWKQLSVNLKVLAGCLSFIDKKQKPKPPFRCIGVQHTFILFFSLIWNSVATNDWPDGNIVSVYNWPLCSEICVLGMKKTIHLYSWKITHSTTTKIHQYCNKVKFHYWKTIPR